EAPLPEPGADPRDPRPVDRQVHRASRDGAARPEGRTRIEGMIIMALTQVYRVYIKATPEAIFEAITSPEWTIRYGYNNYADFDLRPGGAYRARASEEFLAVGAPEIVVDGEVVEVDPPRKLVQTWRMLMTPPDAQPEGFTRLTYEIADTQQSGVC